MNRKKTVIISALSVALFGTGVGAYQLGSYNAQKSDNSVSYVKTDKSDSKAQATAANKTPDQISKEEGISAEQIVVKITDDGYVTSHGDHYHYYNGKVPYDAIISEELIMKDPSYVFNKVKDGYIIKVNGKYYLYLKEGSKRTNVRTKEQIQKQREEWSKGGSKGESGKHSSAKTQALSASVREAKASGRYTTDDGYVFSPTDVIDDMGDAFLVPHGDHFHYIPKADLSPSELSAAQAYWNRKTGRSGNSSKPSNSSSYIHASAPSGNVSTGRHANAPISIPRVTHANHWSKPAGNHATAPKHHAPTTKPINKDSALDKMLKRLYAQPLSARYVESDGLVYDPAQVNAFTAIGVSIPHGNHFHFIHYKDMSPLELEATRMVAEHRGHHIDALGKKDSTEKPKHISHEPNKEPHTEEEHHAVTPKDQRKGKPNSQIVYSAQEIEDDQLIVPHHNHYHNVPMAWFDKGGLWKAPEGYTLQQLFSTIKYYMEHPNELPKEKGWGHDSDHNKGSNKDNKAKNYAPDEEPEDSGKVTHNYGFYDVNKGSDEEEPEKQEDESELDEYELGMAQNAKKYGMDRQSFEKQLIQLSNKYSVSFESFNYINGNQVQVTKKDGSKVLVDIKTLAEVK
ncbi:Streptococcal histidine triad family protein [Streptococcus agalactiae]|nr:Streptococcal histidine triad family protein [Streptococcus agalactiae]AUO94260.1 Streptococcal histidine triad family protein [Streptococcus agalactiae]AUP05634.1 Streptococcal histidine triad family protein [Streptococcus agalactiae]AUP07278.1 Streptococcal histidine triad family protein [Streptococcus agalactiae]AUP11989.1 Streptococcal histidine triad family protein [Streptococcus agalactiae]